MMDKERHGGNLTSFLAEALVDLSAVEPDDMLVVGTQAQYEAASRFPLRA
eukprot:CAMPEP_0170467032 /NCGR_PEP_ID=MMETSP0123-20130129/10765_1 /TAXON_ID=182087 /ORGANISM="Favella ehrenbergii, Strain Fehren 1" /LENGTH=49 /DNA_ID=CAMNT_0010733301 /DNA_START=246 /DNA_END=395 /DNA_ORIENTATION=+